MFAALAIGMSYVLAPLINIEVMSVLLFISGLLYGRTIGLFVGLVSSIIYYGWNPFGVSPLPIYMVCVGCMAFIGFLGGVLHQSSSTKTETKYNFMNLLKFALLGLIYTFIFDILTNLAIAYVYYGGNIVGAFLYGAPFMLIHIVSNVIIFTLLIPPVHHAVLSL